MSIIISIILICVSLVIILMIIIKKLPTLAILDIENMPGEKEAKFKDQIIKARVERDLARWGGGFARLWLFLNRRLTNFLKSSQAKLKKIKLGYKTARRLPWPEKFKRIRELLIMAEDLLKKESYEEAEEKLVEIISLDQKNLQAFFKLGGLYETQKKWPEARQTYEYALKLARQYKSEPEIMEDLTLQEIYFSLAWLEKEAGNFDRAQEYISEALDLEPNQPRYLDLILDLSIIKKDKEAAQEYLERIARTNPDNNKLADWEEMIRNI